MSSAAFGSLPRWTKGTFIPRKDEIMVGTEITIVMPARNFMILLRLLLIMAA